MSNSFVNISLILHTWEWDIWTPWPDQRVFVKSSARLVSIQSINRMPIWRQSTANPMSSNTQSDVDPIPVRCQVTADPVPSQCQSSTTPISISSIIATTASALQQHHSNNASTAPSHQLHQHISYHQQYQLISSISASAA